MKRLKKWATLWAVLVISLLLAAGYLIPKSKLNSNVLSLLPQEKSSNIPTEIIDGFQNRLDKQLVWLIKPAKSDNIAPVQWWYDNLKKQEFIGEVNGLFDQQFQQNWGGFAYKYRYQLVDSQTIDRLHSNKQLDWVLSQLYSPFSGVSSTELKNDPLLLTRASQIKQLSETGNLSIKQNWLTAKDGEGNIWYMLYAELKNSSFNMSQSHQIVDKLNQLNASLKKRWPDVEILKRGVLFYSDNASDQAQKDISTIGSLSIIGIIILILIVFRSVSPIFLSILSISIGILSGLVAVLACFGEIHIITLVMSTSVIGIAIDYAIHYLTERLLHGNQESSYQTLTKLLSTLTIALATGLIAHFILLVTPFPALKQLSIFAIFGLVGAFATVVCWYPFLVKKLPVREKTAQRLLVFWLTLWQKKTMQVSMVALALIFIGFGLLNLNVDDDIGRLQALPASLKSEEQKIIDITKQSADQKWFIVNGQTAEQTLQRLENFIPKLEQAKKEGLFEQYQTVNLSSQQKQLKNIDTIKQYSPAIIDALTRSGIKVNDLSFGNTENLLITPEIWQNSPLSQGRKLLWLTLANGHSAALIPVGNIKNIAGVIKMAEHQSGINWLDRRQSFNDMFARYRMHLSQFLAIAVILICFSFIYRNRSEGVIIAVKSALPTLLSVGSALSILGLTNQPLNVFSMLALILVIGIGIDYSLFLSNDKNHTTSSLLAVSMAALTTLLSFGLLAMSHTSAIVGFGLVLTGGIFTAFLFAPLVQTHKKTFYNTIN